MGLLAAGGAATVVLANEFARGPALAGATTARTATTKQHVDGVSVLGAAYLKAYPHEADTTFLVARLPGVDPTRRVRHQLPALAPAITADFVAGRVVTVQGWQLSRTEARAAAAVTLGA